MPATLFQEHSSQSLQELHRKKRERAHDLSCGSRKSFFLFFWKLSSQPINGWMPPHLKGFATALHYYNCKKKTVLLLTLPNLQKQYICVLRSLQGAFDWPWPEKYVREGSGMLFLLEVSASSACHMWASSEDLQHANLTAKSVLGSPSQRVADVLPEWGVGFGACSDPLQSRTVGHFGEI